MAEPVRPVGTSGPTRTSTTPPDALPPTAPAPLPPAGAELPARPPSVLLAGPAVQYAPPGLPPPGPTGPQAPVAAKPVPPSPWWPKPGEKRLLEINGNNFWFHPTSVVGERISGTVKGPLGAYNGTYTISRNAAAPGEPARLTFIMRFSGNHTLGPNINCLIAFSIRETAAGPRATVRSEDFLADAGTPARAQQRTGIPVAATDDGWSFTVTLKDRDDDDTEVEVEWANP